MGCLYSRNKIQDAYDYSPLSIDEEKVAPYRELTISKYFNIWIPFESREKKVNHIFYRSYENDIPRQFYNL